MAAENQLVEEWLRAARQADGLESGQFGATMALAEGVKWIGELLAELVEVQKAGLEVGDG